MENLSIDIIKLLRYLIPGFIAASIFYSLTPFPKQSPFERTVQALIFTVFIQALVYGVKSILIFVGKRWTLLEWNTNFELPWSIIIAILLGLIFSYLINNDKTHKKLRDLNITKETSYFSEWYSAFSNKENITYIVLHFEDGRRLYGWPKEFPSAPEKGHFIIEKASWLDDNNNEIGITGVKSVIVDVKEINLIEFIEKHKEN
jgi:putative flippase GtrA